MPAFMCKNTNRIYHTAMSTYIQESYIAITVLDICIFGREIFLLTLCENNIVEFLHYANIRFPESAEATTLYE